MSRTLSLHCIHVVPSIANEASGPSYSVPRLCRELSDRGMDIELLVSDTKPSSHYAFPVHWYASIGPLARRLGRSPSMYSAMKSKLIYADIVHNHSLWMMSNVYPGLLVNRTNCKLVTSPRGTLSKWALKRGSLRKCLLWSLGQRLVLYRATCFHATSDAEYQDIRRLGFKQPVAIIPNGYDLPSWNSKGKTDKPKQRLLYFGRIHPIKALDRLIDAWSSIASETNQWELQLVGPGEPRYVEEIRRLIAAHCIKNIAVRGPVYGVAKSKEYYMADAYVLPSHSENFAMTVAEALAHGLPCIVSKGAPWSGLEREDCGWWVQNDRESLVLSLRAMMNRTPIELEEMGMRGRRWIERDFGWQAIASQMAEVYSWIHDKTIAPKCVKFD
jgi:glycosyltransferase involved in cell wall biosynthesis